MDELVDLLINFVQLTAILRNLNIEIPEEMRKILSALAIFNIDVRFLALDCL